VEAKKAFAGTAKQEKRMANANITGEREVLKVFAPTSPKGRGGSNRRSAVPTSFDARKGVFERGKRE
jgi:hypothetical protein